MTTAKRVAVVGGAGSFGRSLVEGLLQTTDCAVVVCGRSLENARAAAAHFPQHAARLSVAALDRLSVTTAEVAALGAFCVIDAAGPFQAQEPRLARAAIDAGAHYLDLADARDFIAGFAALDGAAKARGVLAVTGASSTPALSHAVIDDLTRGWTRVDEVEIAIAPGNQSSPLGLSVFQSILSYVGRPVRVWLRGRWTTAPGWGLTVRRRIGDLGLRWLSLVETPDLDLVPQRFPSVRTAVFRAGLELSFFHQGLMALALLVRTGLMKSLTPLAEVLRDTAAVFRRWGSDCGGMTVDVTGVYADGTRLGVTWTLIAEAGDGPKIPTLPALAIVRQLLDGRLARRGATACTGVIDLAAIEAEFKRLQVRTWHETRVLERAPLFVRALPGFEATPEAVRGAHTVDPACELRGVVNVDGAETWVARVVALIVGFPRTGRELPASVTLEREGDGEIWIRRFGTHEFHSILHAGVTRGTLTERFGALTFDLDAQADVAGFALAITRARLGRIVLPRILTPQTRAVADADEHRRYRFDVTIEMPWIGRLVRYRGWLLPSDGNTAG